VTRGTPCSASSNSCKRSRYGTHQTYSRLATISTEIFFHLHCFFPLVGTNLLALLRAHRHRVLSCLAVQKTPLNFAVCLQGALDERQENMISKLRLKAQRHTTDHTMQVSEAELQIVSLESDFKDMKRYIQKTHTALVRPPQPASLLASLQ
jgi:hypothetical protein